MSHADLVGAITRLGGVPWSGTAYRHVAAGRPPLSGEGARITGGRWNPRGSFAVLYLGLSEETVVAEFQRFAKRQGLAPESFLPRAFYTYDVALDGVLDLRDPAARKTLSLADRDLSDDDLRACQAIGEAASTSGIEAIIAPGATGRGDVCAVFVGALGAKSHVEVVDSQIWEAVPRSD